MTGSRVTGEARLRRTLAGLAAGLAGPGMASATSATSAAMVSHVRALTPRRSGALAASVRSVPSGPLTAAVTATAAYAAPIEYGVGSRRGLRGGHNIRAARMLSRGATEATPAAIANATGAVQSMVRRVQGA